MEWSLTFSQILHKDIYKTLVVNFFSIVTFRTVYVTLLSRLFRSDQAQKWPQLEVEW